MKKIHTIRWGGWNLPVLFSDKDLIAIDKPAGLLTVPIPKSNAISAEFILNQTNKDSDSPIKAVHRIDRYTSGIVLFSKDRWTYQKMVRHFLAHEPIRTYYCWVHGIPEQQEGELVHYLKLIKAQFKNVLSTEKEGGERARLTYKTVVSYANAALLEVKLDTGFKNQIRVQFAAIGHPIIGERQYTEQPDFLLDRPALHAKTLEIIHPRTKKPVVIESTLPKELKELDKQLFDATKNKS